MPNSGDIIYASDINAAIASVAAIKVLKPADTSRASTTTVSADPDLLVNLASGKYYTLISNIIFSGDPTGDLKGGIYAPSGGSFTGTVRAQNASASAASGSIVTDVQTGTAFQFGCLTGTSLTALIVGTLYTGTGGNAGFTWAQVTSSATATLVKANSFITLIPLA